MDTQGSGSPAPRRGLVAVLLATLGVGLILLGSGHGAAEAPSTRTVRLVLAARPLGAGTVLAAGDVSDVSVAASDAVAGLAHSDGDVVGRRLGVAVPAGLPLSAALISDAPVAAPGHRLVRLALDAASTPPDLDVDGVVDVLAAVPDGSDGGRVVLAATARVLAVSGGGTPVVTLDLDPAAAARVVWAQDFAKSLRLLVRASPSDAGVPPSIAGLGP